MFPDHPSEGPIRATHEQSTRSEIILQEDWVFSAARGVLVAGINGGLVLGGGDRKDDQLRRGEDGLRVSRPTWLVVRKVENPEI